VKTSWQVTTIGDSCRLSSGGTPSRGNKNYWVGDIPWVSAKDLKSERISGALLHISAKAVRESATNIAPVGSLLMLVRGMGLANGIQIGEVCSPVAFNQDIRAIHPPKALLPRFLLLAIKNSLMDGGGSRVMSAAAHGTLKIDTDALKKVQFPLPPIAEQRLIVKSIDESFALVATLKEQTQRKLAALDELKKSLLHQAFTGRL
jgi:restriction endonuclease S subunit